MNGAPSPIDATDLKILQTLGEDARTSWADLGRTLDLAPTSVADRYQKLLANGLIRRATVTINPQSLGLEVLAFLYVTLDRAGDGPPFLKFVESTPEIEECHSIAGDEDYILKVRVPNLPALETFISSRVKANDGIVRVRSSVSTSTHKSNPLAAITTTKPPKKSRR